MTGPREIRALVTQRRWLKRVFQLSGSVEATVEVNARGFPESWVRVRGVIVPTEHNHHPLRFTDWTFRFTIPGESGDLFAVLTVYAPFREFRELALAIEGVTVYEELDYGRTVTVGETPVSLPIPASSPEIDIDDLPISKSGQSTDFDDPRKQSGA